METQIENKKCVWDGMTNQYSLLKTLRFELKPIGKTLDNIRNLIEEDKQRYKDFEKVKKIMDKYYSYFISRVLNNKVKIDKNSLNEYKEIYFNLKKKTNDLVLKKQLESIQKNITKNISLMIKSDEDFKNIFSKEFIRDILKKYLNDKDSKDDLELVSKFDKWTTYFTGFYNNRKNVFSDKDIPTSIIYRIVYDNLPKYLDNLYNLEKLKEFNIDFSTLNENFSESIGNKNLLEYFGIENFNEFLSQEGIDKYNYLIGGYSEDEKTKKKGINQIIYEYSKQNKEDSDVRKLKLNVLFKQILSEKNRDISFRFSSFVNSEEMLLEIKSFYDKIKFNNIFNNIETLFEDLNKEKYDKNGIFIKKNKLNYLSNDLFGNFSTLNILIKDYVMKNYKECNTDAKFEKWFKSKKLISLSLIEISLFNIDLFYDEESSELKKYYGLIEKEKNNPISYYLSKFDLKGKNIFNEINENYIEFEKLISNNIIDKNNLNFEEKEIKRKQTEIIKSFLDSILKLNSYIEIFSDKNIKNEIIEKDNDFYNEYEKILNELFEVIGLYNKVRNYITKKRTDVKKFKLNFEETTLLSGWDLNKESANLSIILRKKENFYLGIMNKSNNKIFDKIPSEFMKSNENSFEKMEYKLLPDPSKMLPKVFFSKKNIEYFSPSQEILDIRNYSSYTKDGEAQKGYTKKDFNLQDCHKIIDFYKESIYKHNEWKIFNFKFKSTNEYIDSSEFFKDVSSQGYKLSFIHISNEYIQNLVNEGKLYLFQIYNKDFSENKKKKGKDNLHTIYWKELFSEENLKDVIYKLNGEAEIFFREKAFDAHITHPKNKEVENKDFKEEYKKLGLKSKSKFDYDLIKDKRYTYDKFLFHCPITINFKSPLNVINFNDKINEIIKNNSENIKILSIDRGERHLAYYTLLNSKGEIEKQESFNLVQDTFGRKLDYHEKLDKLEVDRDKARKNWNTIENIKELKEGYLSQIIHKIANIIIQENAIVIFEDLNFGFKKGRFKIEKQIYQKFEKMLIDKLNYLMFKNLDKNRFGGCLKAYQLTQKFKSFKELGNQTGIIFYVNASYTSKICPLTGFINHIYPRYENLEQVKKLLEKFNFIRYNKDKDYFEFSYKVSNFNKKLNLIKDDWTLCTFGERLINLKDKNGYFKTEKINLTEKLKDLFEDYNIDFENGLDFKNLILEQVESSFFKSLIFYMKTLMSLRNSYTESEIKEIMKKEGDNFNLNNYDYILSPVQKNGVFFDSRKVENSFPKNADANGAYNIGLKGLMIIEKIKKISDVKKINLKIEKQDYLNFLISRNQ